MSSVPHEAAGVRGKTFAVVGSGVSGLATAWLLRHHGADVTLFESEASCGGHTLTDNTSEWPVDLGFQVYNLSTYPHFVGWLEQLGVETEPSDMSFSLSIGKGALEWASHGLDSIFAQWENMSSRKFLRMIWDVLRFGREAPDVLKPENQARYMRVSLGQYLTDKGCACAWCPAPACTAHQPQPCLACNASHLVMAAHLGCRQTWRASLFQSRTGIPARAGTARRSGSCTWCPCARRSGPCLPHTCSSSPSSCSCASGRTTTCSTCSSGRCGASCAAAATSMWRARLRACSTCARGCA
jgi:NAD(P)-binding Rossmann-like domain